MKNRLPHFLALLPLCLALQPLLLAALLPPRTAHAQDTPCACAVGPGEASPSRLVVEACQDPYDIYASASSTCSEPPFSISTNYIYWAKLDADQAGFTNRLFIPIEGKCPHGRTMTSSATVEVIYNPGGGCQSCSDPGAKTAENKSLNFSVSLGHTAGGRFGGRLGLYAAVPPDAGDLSLFSPSALAVQGGDLVDVIRRGGDIRQVRASECLVKVDVLDDYSYTLSFFADGDVLEELDGDGLYQTGAAQPFVVYTLENPDGEAACYRLRITETRGATAGVSEFTWQADAAGGGVWTLTEGGGLRTVALTEADGVKTWVTSGVDGAPARTVRKAYTNINERTLLAETVEDPDGAALTTRTTYYTDESEANRYGRAEMETRPDGSWVKYTYTPEGRTATITRGWLDGGEGDLCHVTAYDYAPFLPTNFPTAFPDTRDTGKANPGTPRVETVTVNGVPVSKTLRTAAIDNSGYRHIEEVRLLDPSATNLVAAWQDPANPRTTSIYMPDDGSKPCSGDLEKITRPDGSASHYRYKSGTYTPGPDGGPGAFEPDGDGIFDGPDFRTTVTHGTTNSPHGIAHRTTQEIIYARKSGKQEFLRETRVCATPGGKSVVYERIAWTATTRDKLGRVTMVRHSDGTYTETAWEGNRVAHEIGADGVKTEYAYDALGRVTLATRQGDGARPDTETATVYDAAGRALSTTVSSGGLSLTTTNAYDLAGRLVWTRSPDNVETAYAYGILPDSSNRYTTVISGHNTPLAATNTTVYHLDGKVAWTEFNGERKTTYAYGVNPDHTQWTATYEGPAGTNSPAWAVSTRDPLGRTVEQRRPGHGGTVLVTSNAYDTAGRLLASTVSSSGGAVHSSTLYSYDELGQLTLTAQDLNLNGQIDLAGPDRVTSNATEYVKLPNRWWRESKQYAYPGGGSGIPLLVSTRRDRLTGLGTSVFITVLPSDSPLLTSESVSIDALGNATTSQSHLDRAARSQVSWVKGPASAQTAYSIAVHGLTLTNATGTGVVTAYAHDALGRVLTNATVSGNSRVVYNAFAYDTHGRLASVTDATGAATTFAYDELGRRTAVTDALGQVTHTAYDAENRVTLTHGATYPVGYEYDTFGRLAAMHTWRDENGAPDTTLWLYEDATGLLTNKVYADGNGPSYAYTPDGKLLTRTWARGTVTTYAYDAAGNLTNVTYSDDTPALAFTHDRLGRQTSAATLPTNHYPLTTEYAYSLLGLLTNETVKVAQTFLSADASITRTYDPLGRPASLNVATASLPLELAYSYDTLGRLSTVSSGSGAVHGTYAYLTGTRLLASTTVSNNSGATLTAQRIYEQNRDLTAAVQNSLTATHYPLTTISRFDYENDALGRRTHRIDTGAALDVFPTHGNPNPEASPAFEAYGYNGRSEVTSSARYRGENTADTSKPLHGRARAYAYDAIGNRIQSSDGIPAVVSSYTANALNQYTSRTVPDTLPITGDAPTNVNVYVNGALADRQRTHWHAEAARQSGGGIPAAEYAEVVTEAVYLPPDPQDPDEYTATTNHVFFAQSPEAFTYDLDGNMTSDGRFTYTWNAENRLIKAETRNDLPPEVPRYKIEYAYDHQGRMVFKEVSTNHYPLTTTHYTWDGWNIIAETAVPLTPSSLLPTTSFYVWGLDLSGTPQGAGGVGGLLAVIKDDGIYYPCYDANGNITEYVDTNGNIVAHREYDAFGNTVVATGATDAFTHWFNTKPWCEITSLCEYLFRPNSPSLGRWLCRDPIEEWGGLNLYGFARNDGVNFVDVLGLSALPMVWNDSGPNFSDGEYIAIYGVANIVFSVTWELTGYDCCDPKQQVSYAKQGPDYFHNPSYRSFYPLWNSKDINSKTIRENSDMGSGLFSAGEQGTLVITMAWISDKGFEGLPPRTNRPQKQRGYTWNIYKKYPSTDTVFPPFDNGPVPDEANQVIITCKWNLCNDPIEIPTCDSVPKMKPGENRRPDWRAEQERNRE